MKKLLFVFSIVFILISCDSGNMDNSENTGNETDKPNLLIGTWEYEVIDENWEKNGVRYLSSYTFHNDTEFTANLTNYLKSESAYTGNGIAYKGTYTRDDNFLYFDCTCYDVRRTLVYTDTDEPAVTYEHYARGQENIKSYYELTGDILHIGRIDYPISGPDSPDRKYDFHPHKKR
jgi:hypothetical protein